MHHDTTKSKSTSIKASRWQKLREDRLYTVREKAACGMRSQTDTRSCLIFSVRKRLWKKMITLLDSLTPCAWRCHPFQAACSNKFTVWSFGIQREKWEGTLYTCSLFMKLNVGGGKKKERNGIWKAENVIVTKYSPLLYARLLQSSFRLGRGEQPSWWGSREIAINIH